MKHNSSRDQTLIWRLNNCYLKYRFSRCITCLPGMLLSNEKSDADDSERTHCGLPLLNDTMVGHLTGFVHGPLTSYVKLGVAHALGMPDTFQRKPLVSDPGMHHGTCVTHVPWCMSGSVTPGGGKKTFPAFLAHVQPTVLRIWQEVHCVAM